MDKPSGVSSARAVAAAKRALPKKTKVGHTGTLDPLASGLLVLTVGRATRLSRYVGDLQKVYTASARFGAVSDTLDAEGRVEELDSGTDESSIRRNLPEFTGEVEQVPPMASAVKRDGRRLYELHREGRVVGREARRVSVREFELLAFDEEVQTATFRVRCGGGTYVRSLVADLAASLGTGAYLTALRREAVGGFRVEEAVEVRDLSPEKVSGRLFLPASAAVAHLEEVPVGEEEARKVASGRALSSFGLEGSVAVTFGGELLAVYRDDGCEARPEVVLCGG